jgi:hypothetical protein
VLHRRSSKRHFAIYIPQVKFLLPVVLDKANERSLSIQLDPTTVDVNVHPTKREVHFLEEEGITESIADAIQAKLAQSGERTFEYQVGVHHLHCRLATELTPLSRLCSLEASLPQTLEKERRERAKAILPHLLRHRVPLPLRKSSHSTKFARLVRTEPRFDVSPNSDTIWGSWQTRCAPGRRCREGKEED